MEIDTETSVPVRVQELWFDDGNLIIQAESSLFRVYRGVLAARSSVFQDMLLLPQPLDSELLEGCPLVRMHDNAAEVTVFLKAIFDSEYFEAYPALTAPEVVAGILRLSHKYSVDYLRRRALVHLSSVFFTTLGAGDDWIDDTSPWQKPSFAVSDDPGPATTHIIQIAREVGALWVLPYAFYFLADGCAQWECDLLTWIKPDTFNGALAQLSEADQKAFVKGYCAQIGTAGPNVLRFLHTPGTISRCLSESRCPVARLDALEIAHSRHASPGFQADPLFLWRGDDWTRLEGTACQVCVNSLKRTHQRARQDFWDQLPQMYGLPPWAELEQMKADALRPL